jgi:hypothetical protein
MAREPCSGIYVPALPGGSRGRGPLRLYLAILLASKGRPSTPEITLACRNARFKAISLLKEILSMCMYKSPSYDLWEKMRGRGWAIEGTWEESESIGSDNREDEY